jgi:hypothetical protein
LPPPSALLLLAGGPAAAVHRDFPWNGLFSGQDAAVVQDVFLVQFAGQVLLGAFRAGLLHVLLAGGQGRLGKIVLEIEGTDHNGHPLASQENEQPYITIV